MALFFKLAFWLHVAAGGVALLVFWVPLVTKKGGKVHRRVGWVYVGAAATIAATSFVSCARMLTDDRPRNDRAAVFLTYVGVLAAANAFIGVRALRAKRRTTASWHVLDVAPAALLATSGLAVAVYGLLVVTPLYVIFGGLGVLLGSGQLRFWLRAPATPREWLYAHMMGMGTSCITTVTAFLVVNARQLGLETFNVVVWVAPAVLGGAGLFLWRRRLSAASRLDAGG